MAGAGGFEPPYGGITRPRPWTWRKLNEVQGPSAGDRRSRVPPEALWREIGKQRTMISLGELLRLKELFGASFQAIVYRCHDLGIIPNAAYRRLFQVFNEARLA